MLPCHIVFKPRVIITHICIVMPPGHLGGGLRSHSELLLLFKARPQEPDRNQDTTEH